MNGKVGNGASPPPRREEWSRPGKLEELLPFAKRLRLPFLDVEALIRVTPHPGQAYFTGLTLAEWLCRTADRVDPSRVPGSYRGFWRGPSKPNPAILRALLQQHQNASVIGQRCASLSPRFSRPGASNRRPSSADSITTMPGFGFSVHTGPNSATSPCRTLRGFGSRSSKMSFWRSRPIRLRWRQRASTCRVMQSHRQCI
jgi:hypothetical protein